MNTEYHEKPSRPRSLITFFLDDIANYWIRRVYRVDYEDHTEEMRKLILVLDFPTDTEVHFPLTHPHQSFI